jgi:RNA polymerase sigma factor (sigma-70 family)
VAKREIHSTRRRRQLNRDLAHASAEPDPAVETMDYPLQQALSDLPGAYRRVILLRYYGGLSCQALAEELNMPLGTVTKMLSRAYGMLREALQGKQAVTEDRAEVQP